MYWIVSLEGGKQVSKCSRISDKNKHGKKWKESDNAIQKIRKEFFHEKRKTHRQQQQVLSRHTAESAK